MNGEGDKPMYSSIQVWVPQSSTERRIEAVLVEAEKGDLLHTYGVNALKKCEATNAV